MAIVRDLSGNSPIGSAVDTPKYGMDYLVQDDDAGQYEGVSTTASTILTPAAGIRFARITADNVVYITTDNSTPVAATDGGMKINQNTPEIIAVRPGIPVKAIAPAGTVSVQITPLMNRDKG
jgi:hypothetical protein